MSCNNLSLSSYKALKRKLLYRMLGLHVFPVVLLFAAFLREDLLHVILGYMGLSLFVYAVLSVRDGAIIDQGLDPVFRNENPVLFWFKTGFIFTIGSLLIVVTWLVPLA